MEVQIERGSQGCKHGITPTPDFQADRPHERQRITLLHDAWAELIVENDCSRVEPILEMDVHRLGPQRVGNFGQRQVMGGDKSDRAGLDEAADDGFRPGAAIQRVGAVEDFVEEK
jgi:hypothetical protein